MRLDLFLKTARLIKRRTIAKEFCDRGLVVVNGKAAKPSYEVKDGDQITLKFGEIILELIAHIEIKGTKEIVSYEGR